ncbi:hypothetical protein L7F22_062459 [Adiantum nelumboides]|nr:hypothetical protein [Adiantum nelumboides]
MGRSKRIEWQYVEKIKALRKGQWTCKCNFCGHVWGGGPHLIRSHLLSLPGQGVGPCDSVTEDVKDIVRRLHADASSDGKDSREAIDALVDDLGGSASQSQGDASLSTHGEGSTHASGSSKSNVNSSKKRKVAQGFGGLPAAFGLQARKQADQALRRFFYAEDVPEWKVRSPYFLDMIKAIGNVGPSYVPPSYHALRTTELNDEVQCLKKEIMGVREKWKRYGCTIVCDGWSDTRRRPIINFLACSIHGSVFLKAVDTSGQTKTSDFIFRLHPLKALAAEAARIFFVRRNIPFADRNIRRLAAGRRRSNGQQAVVRGRQAVNASTWGGSTRAVVSHVRGRL